MYYTNYSISFFIFLLLSFWQSSIEKSVLFCFTRVSGYGWAPFFLKSLKNFKKTIDNSKNIIYNIIAKQRKGDVEMVLKFAIQTVFEILLVAGVIYGFTKEDKFIEFEEKIVEKFKKH